jgi:hypothetical protein
MSTEKVFELASTISKNKIKLMMLHVSLQKAAQLVIERYCE